MTEGFAGQSSVVGCRVVFRTFCIVALHGVEMFRS